MARPIPRALFCILVLSLALVSVASADDRELLRDKTADPYVFIVMDNSGSMHRTPPCSPYDAATDIDPWDGVCTSLCPLEDASCAQVCPSWGCVEYEEEANSSDFIEVTVDNVDATLEGDAGSWTKNLDLYSTKIGTDFAFVAEGDTGAITYEATLPEAGEYHVFLQWHRITDNDEAIDARVTVTHADGRSYQEVDMFSSEVDSQFNYIGTFDFAADFSGEVLATVRVDNETTGDEIAHQGIAADGTTQAITADAVRFYRQPEPSGGLTCKVNGWRCEQPLCPLGGCQAPLGADDPTSKFFQAKQALYEVLGQIDGVHFGFATYEQDDSALIYKHYAYKARETQDDGVTAQNTFNSVLDPADQLQGFDWPMIGAVEVFGTGASYDDNGNTNDSNLVAVNQWNCNTDFDDQRGDPGFEDDHWVGCTAYEPADVNDIWEMQRFLRIPRLGRTADLETRLYIRDTDDTVYRIDYEYLGFNLGLSQAYDYPDSVFGIQLDLHRCTNDSCSSRTQLIYNMNVYYDLVSDYSDANTVLSRRNNPTLFFQRNSTVYNGIITEVPGSACFDRGLEPNNDLLYLDSPYDDFVTNLQDDAWWDYAHKWPWRTDDRGEKNVDDMALSGLDNNDSDYYDEDRDRVMFMDYGDMVPLDWESRNVDIIRRHLAPNAWRVADGADGDAAVTELTQTGETPDFRTAIYFNDQYVTNASNNRRRLTLKDEDERPLLASGMTPLNRALTDFQSWYLGEDNASCDIDPGENPVGWCQYAAVFDLNWSCKQKYVLMITDGDETCDLPAADENYAACDKAAELLSGPGIKTFVVGFGLPELEDENALQCMASQGGTGDPILPKNKDELVDELLALFSSVKAEKRSFASASIPAVQSSASDKIYLSSFTPIPGAAFWPGRVDVFRQPLPLTDDLRPDVSRTCGVDGRQSACHLFDVAEKILDQAPDEATLEDDQLPPGERFGIQVGVDDELTTETDEEELTNVSNRRIFYGMANPNSDRTQPLRLLWPNAYDDSNAGPYRLDLADVLVLADDLEDYYACDPMVDDCTSAEEGLDEALQFAVEQMVKKKVVSIQDEDGLEVQCTGDPEDTSQPCTYVMGDVFHANPQVTTAANNFDFFRQDLCGTPLEDGTPTSCVPATEFSSAAKMRERGYREFTRRTTWRRRMLATATNDGQLHFFDAGKYIELQDEVLGKVDVFTDGTGYELFSYMPRMVMPVVRDQVNQGDLEPAEKHIFSMDGTPKAADVFIDPIPDELGEYAVTDREWRSVLIGGVREAGDVFDEANDVLDVYGGYYALDLTTPDPMVTGDGEFAPLVPENPGKFLPECLAVDSETGLQTTVTGCSTAAGEAVPFPLELWSFQDLINVDNTQYPLDEDINGFRDLGDTWSTPVIGQIMVCKKGGTQCDPDATVAAQRADLETRWVAMVGGGMDSVHKNNPVIGNWIYFIDIELGEVIYKRSVDGAVPSDVAALDVDNDGILDRIYFGTTTGKLYKIDLTARDSTGKIPAIREQEIGDAKIIGFEDLDSLGVPVPDVDERKFPMDRVIHTAWDPFLIFDAGGPIYFPPALFKIPELEFYGFTLSTGDREDLWEENGDIGYYVVGVDENFTSTSSGLPLDIDDMARFPWDDTVGSYKDSDGDDVELVADESLDLLTNSPADRPGWVMVFPEEFRATGEPFVLSGILIFSMFEPLNFTIDDLADDDGDDTTLDTQTVCAQSGTTYAFVTFLRSSAPLLSTDVDDEDDTFTSSCGGRCEVIDEFTTALHTESSVSKNPDSSADGDTVQTTYNRAQTEREKKLANEIRDAILELMPRSCQFNENYEMLVSALRNSTGINVYARVPMLVCPGDWRN